MKTNKTEVIMNEETAAAQERLMEKRNALDTSQPTQIIGEKPDQCLTTEDQQKIEAAKCERHGYNDPGWQRVKYIGVIVEMCPTCAADHRAENEEKEQREEERQKKERIHLKMIGLQIGKRFKGVTIDDYEPVNPDAAKIKEICRRYIDTLGERVKDGDSLIMIGSCGTGKNMLAAIICQEAVKSEFTAVHTTIFKLVRKVKDSWRDKETSEEQVIRSFSEPDLLVIDEVGVQFGSDTEKLYITEIINDRYENRKPTILISNLNLVELEDTLGQRVVDRFLEGKSMILRFSWESYRRGG